jgi:hypothetical protein
VKLKAQLTAIIFHTDFFVQTYTEFERDHLGDTGVEGRIILRWILRKWVVGGMEWIDLAQARDRWRALVNALMNLQVP